MIHARLRAAAGRDRIPTDGLIAWYTMDNISGSTLVDEQGNYDGTLVGSFNSPTGVVGSALEANDTSDYVTIANLGAWLRSRSTFGLSMWIKPNGDTAGVGPQFCVSYSSHTSPFYLAYVIFNSNSQLFVCTSNDYRFSFSNSLDTSRLYHVALSYESSTFRVYVDKALWVDEPVAAAMPAASVSTAMLGRIPALNNSNNAARIEHDEIRVYDRALSAQEVTALYNEGA